MKKTSGNMSLMLKKTIGLISMDPRQRSEANFDEILTWMRRKFDNPACNDSDVLRQVLSKCGHRKCERDEIIVQQGDSGQCYYFILFGKVSVYVDIKKSLMSAAPQKVTQTVDRGDKLTALNQSTHHSNHCSSSDHDNASSLDNQPITDTIEVKDKDEKKVKKEKKQEGRRSARKLFGKYMVSLYEGQSFGEVALLTDEKVRTATVICEQTTHLLTIEKDLFGETLQSLLEMEFQSRHMLIESNPMFRRWSQKNKKSFEWCVQRRTFSFDSHIVTQGEPCDGVMIITSGSASVLVEPGKHAGQYKDQVPFIEHEDVYEMELNKKKQKVKNIEKEINSPRMETVAVRRKQGYAAAEKRIQNKLINLCSIETGDIIGDIEAIMGLDTYLFTVKALSEVQVYLVSSRNVERFFSKQEKHAHEYLKEQVIAKLNTRVDTIQGANVPFLKHALVKIKQDGRQPYRRPVINIKNKLPEDGEMFEQLLCNYIDNKAELVTPRVHGGDYYKTLFRANITRLRSNHEQSLHKTKKKNNVIVRRPKSVKPRTSISLKKVLKEGMQISEEEAKRRFIECYRRQEEFEIQTARLQLESNPSDQTNDVISAKVQQSDQGVVNTNDSDFTDDKCGEITNRGSPFITHVHPTATDNELKLDLSSLDLSSQIKHLNKQVSCPTIRISSYQKPQNRHFSLGQVDIQSFPVVGSHLKATESSTSPFSYDLMLKDDKNRSGRLQPDDMSFHENVREIERLVLPILSENPKYRDCETNDTSLSFLEAKVKKFLLKQDSKSSVGTLPKLQRFEVTDEISQQPLRGGKVLVKQNRCPLKCGDKLKRKDHNHIRCQLLPKLPNYDELKWKKRIRQNSQQDMMSQWLKQEMKQQEDKGRKKSTTTY